MVTADTFLWELAGILDLIPRQPLQETIASLLLAHRFGRTIYILDDMTERAERFLQNATGLFHDEALNVLRLEHWKYDRGRAVPASAHRAEQLADVALEDALENGDILIAVCLYHAPDTMFDIIQAASSAGTVTVGVTTPVGATLMVRTDHCIVLPTGDPDYIVDILLLLIHAITRELHQTIMAQRHTPMSEQVAPDSGHHLQPAGRTVIG